MRAALLFLLFIMAPSLQAAELPVIRLGVLHSGTVSWELTTLQREALDRSNGFQLEVTPYANMSASRLALTGGMVDAIVSDWLWAGQRQAQGQSLWFLPYSTSIGRILVAADSTYGWPQDLRGKRIGVAGGPLSKAWVLLYSAARRDGIDLLKEAEVKFAAPPILNNELENGRLDLLVTFWHFGARLEAKGYKRFLELEQLTQRLGLTDQVPMLGYLFEQTWVQQNPELAQAFSRAVAQTKQRLASQPELWERLRPMMQADDQPTFEALRDGYLTGIPAPLSAAQIESAQRFYTLIDTTRPTPSGHQLNPELFRGLP